MPTLLAGDPFVGMDPFNVDNCQSQRWLAFPIGRSAAPLTATPAPTQGFPHALIALLGKTRATVLHAIAERPGCNTTQLAQHLGVSKASASEHATVLRSAGLTAATRHRNTMLHTLTSAGQSVLQTTA